MKKFLVIIFFVIYAIGCSSGSSTGSAVSTVSSSSTIKKVFATSTTYNGSLGGFTGDSICSSRATAAGLSGTWLAYLSYSGLMTAYLNFTGNGPWYNMDGTTLVANNLTDLANGTIAAAISKNEFGANAGTAFPIWTGFDPAYIMSATTCSSWTSSNPAGTGLVGSNLSPPVFWSASSNYNCANTARIYCFEQ